MLHYTLVSVSFFPVQPSAAHGLPPVVIGAGAPVSGTAFLVVVVVVVVVCSTPPGPGPAVGAGAVVVLDAGALLATVVFEFEPPFRSASPDLSSCIPLEATVVLRSPDAETGTCSPPRPAMRSPAESAKELMFPLCA